MSPVDFIIILLGVAILWRVIEVHYTLKDILYALDPRKKPLKRRKK